MPAGTYEHTGAGGELRLSERFRCAAGSAGWRYTSQLSTPDGREAGSVDLTLDRRGRQMRVVIGCGGWTVRGGTSGAEMRWVRGPAEHGAETEEHGERAVGFTGLTPAFLIATAALVPRTGNLMRVRLIELSGALGSRRLDQQWRLAGVECHGAEGASLEVSAYERIDLDTAVRTTIHIAGDVLLATASVGLAALDSPPGPALHDLPNIGLRPT